MSIFKRKKEKKEVKDQQERVEEVKVDEKDKKEIEKQKDSDEKKEVLKEKRFQGQAYKYLIRPLISEKASGVGIYNQYIFEVAPNSNKIEIKKAIESLYGVKPIKVNILNMKGKNVRYGRNFGKLKNWKKAVVILKAGDKIDVYEGV